MLECVVNISEGRDRSIVERIAEAAGQSLLDVHSDADHHRSVLTLIGPSAARAVTVAAVDHLDLTTHDGAHPRLGVVDVVPFVALSGPPAEAIEARNAFAAWAGRELGLPCFRYGPERSLPQIRRGAFTDFGPDTGPAEPHPTAGACCVGARGLMLAYNLWLAEPDLDLARRIVRSIRSATVRALAIEVGPTVQVSMNLIAPDVTGPADVYDAVAAHAPIARAELVGLAPAAVLARIPERRWDELDLAAGRTIEARLATRGIRN
jgi:glutamate formiminotransferase